MSIRCISTCVLLAAISLSAGSIFATRDATPAMISINIDQPLPEGLFQQVNFAHTLIQIKSTGTDQKAKTTLDQVLTLAAKQSQNYPVIDGFEIDAATTLSSVSARALAMLAAKAVFVSSKFAFQDPADWRIIFAAEQKNPQLLTTVYGVPAMRQLQMTSGMGTAWVNSGVSFSHLFTANGVSKNQALQFWHEASTAAKSTRHAMTCMFLDTGAHSELDMSAIAKSAIGQSDGYLMWVGGNDLQSFVPIRNGEKSLVVWRTFKTGMKGFSYDRNDSPQGLYAALGSTTPAFTVLASLANRAQHATSAGINLLGDAENNIHTYGVLLDLANTIVSDTNHLYLPPVTKTLISARLNMLVLNPSPVNLQKMLSQAPALMASISDQGYLGVFDYSTQSNTDFYAKLGALLANHPGISMSYNTANADNLKQLLTMSKMYKVKEIYLGPEASALFAKQPDVDSFKQIVRDIKINSYLARL